MSFLGGQGLPTPEGGLPEGATMYHPLCLVNLQDPPHEEFLGTAPKTLGLRLTELPATGL